MNLCDLYQRAEAFVQTLVARPPADHGVITPPASLDRRMALAPPSGGTMRLIVPPERLRQK